MNTTERLQRAGELIADRSSSKPVSAEIQVLEHHQAVLESLAAVKVLKTTTAKVAKSAARKPAKKSPAAPASPAPTGAESAAQ